MTPEEIRAARALIGWDAIYLARATNIDMSRLSAIEAGGFIDPDVHDRMLMLFEDKGISFVSEGIGFKTFSFMQGVSRPIMMSRPNHRGYNMPGK